MEGPYRDLGAGFARLAGAEGARRTPSRISSVEDALLELLRNSRDAGARNIYVASTLKNRRYRTLTVLDDGVGIPVSHADLVFEPGVTTRHLSPTLQHSDSSPHGAGLSLYHIRNATLDARVASNANPTSITATFDTEHTPERSLQSATRTSKSNLGATLRRFLQNTPQIHVYHSSPAQIIAKLIKNRIILKPGEEETGWDVGQVSSSLGLKVSRRTVQRIVRGEFGDLIPVSLSSCDESGSKSQAVGDRSVGKSGVGISLGDGELDEIATILRRIAQARYLDTGELRVESRPGELSLKINVFELEDEYE